MITKMLGSVSLESAAISMLSASAVDVDVDVVDVVDVVDSSADSASANRRPLAELVTLMLKQSTKQLSTAPMTG